MRFKVDENLPAEVADLLRAAGHDAVTVNDQGVGGAKDPDLANLLQREQRAFVTLDSGFSDIRTYPPHEYSGFSGASSPTAGQGLRPSGLSASRGSVGEGAARRTPLDRRGQSHPGEE